jgi:hypothetical protein
VTTVSALQFRRCRFRAEESDVAATTDGEGSAASASQVQANRANAERSTGPTSPEGKAKSSRNSLLHGIWASRPIAIVRGNFAENEAAVDSLLVSVVDSLAPRDVLQEGQARNIATLYLHILSEAPERDQQGLKRIATAMLAEKFPDEADAVLWAIGIATEQEHALDDPIATREQEARRALRDDLDSAARVHSRINRELHRALDDLSRMRSGELV